MPLAMANFSFTYLVYIASRIQDDPFLLETSSLDSPNFDSSNLDYDFWGLRLVRFVVRLVNLSLFTLKYFLYYNKLIRLSAVHNSYTDEYNALCHQEFVGRATQE